MQVQSVAPTNPEDRARLDAKVAAEQARYDQVKLETQAWATFLAAGCFAATWAFYTRVSPPVHLNLSQWAFLTNEKIT